jgi:hypothetical protein
VIAPVELVVVVAVMDERLQEPFPRWVMTLNLPVPLVVLYGIGVIVAVAEPAKRAVAAVAIAAATAPRLRRFMASSERELVTSPAPRLNYIGNEAFE